MKTKFILCALLIFFSNGCTKEKELSIKKREDVVKISRHAEKKPTKRVLVLNSYHKGFPWSDNIVKGIESVFESEEKNIEFRIEYMCTKITGYETQYKKKLHELYNYKYGNCEFDVIIATDDNAFDFLREYQKDLFPEIPIVFCGVNNIDASNLIDSGIFTGIIEYRSVRETIDIALRLHAGTKQIVFVIDGTPSGVYLCNQIQGLFKYYKNIRMTFVGSNLSMEQIEDNLSKLSDDTIVLFGPFNRDNSGKYYSPKKASSRVCEASVRPVYGYTVQFLAYGIVGGKLLDGVYHGQIAAKMVQRILMGEKVQDISVITKPRTQYMFNYKQMKRWGIKFSDLPGDSIVIDKPYSFYEKNKKLVGGIIVFMIFQMLIIITLLVNISRRKQLEKKLKQLLTDLKRSNEDLEQFAYIASHDLQEPLRMISNYVQLLARRYQGKLDADADDFINYTVDGVKRMHTLINDLLSYSQTGGRDKLFKPIDCGIVLNRGLSNLQMLVKESGAVITYDVLPVVMANSSQLTQLFQNLIDNAIKFQGEEPPQIHISAKKEKNEWVFSVRDNGIGIEPEFFKRIFIIFQRLHNREEYSGTGIGLALCKKIVECHDGRIWVESEIGKGSIFYFTISIGEKK